MKQATEIFMKKFNWETNEYETVMKFRAPIAACIKAVDILVANKVVQVTFTDGETEKAVCQEPDTFSLEQAITICVAKKMMGGTSAFNKEVRHGIKIYNDKLKKEAADKAEQERIAKKKAKDAEKRAARKAKKELENKEKQIEIQAEAYVRAMQRMKEIG